jgi:2,4-dienoyl-CoA reductase-like NADH-dependent reductase (Old Yellow Enzyme family)
LNGGFIAASGAATFADSVIHRGVHVSLLFSPIRLGTVELANRIVVAPMCQYSADEGAATDWHLLHLGHLALSGAGLLITEATAVMPEGRISPLDLGLWSDATEDALAPVVRAVRRHSPIRLGIQLAHAGRKASCVPPWDGGEPIAPDAGGWQTVAPSAIPFRPERPPPRALDEAGIAALVDAFAASARRAARLGFDVVEIHAAHGYLLHEFLSPLSNRRDDGYGGSLENRLRLPLEVFSAVRSAVPADVAVGVRVSATDWVDGGWDLEQTLALARRLQARGCDYIHVSSGGLAPQQQVPAFPNYQVPFAARIKAATGLTTIAVGLITQAEQAEAIVATGEADAVALARAMLFDPRWPWHAAARLGAKVQAPKQYLRSEPHRLKGLLQRSDHPPGR